MDAPKCTDKVPYPGVDWATVPLDPAKMTPEERAGYEYLVEFLASKLAEKCSKRLQD